MRALNKHGVRYKRTMARIANKSLEGAIIKPHKIIAVVVETHDGENLSCESVRFRLDEDVQPEVIAAEFLALITGKFSMSRNASHQGTAALAHKEGGTDAIGTD